MSTWVCGAYIALPAPARLGAVPARAAKPRSPRKIHPAPSRYHHGNLKEALIKATVGLIQEGGIENVSLREVAKRIGVSPGAPFRHFRSRTDLLTAVAEQTTRALRDEVMLAYGRTEGANPLVRFRSIGTAYMRWVIKNPTQFEVVSNRGLINYEKSPSLRRDNEEIQSLMNQLLNDAQRQGLLRSADKKAIPLAARAAAYGVARMYTDGHLPQWGIDERDVEYAFEAVFDLFVNGLASERAPLLKTRATRRRP